MFLTFGMTVGGGIGLLLGMNKCKVKQKINKGKKFLNI
jgi:hypothetical protein